MEPKTIQDIASGKPAELKTPSITSGEPEVVDAIPVRAPAGGSETSQTHIATDPNVSAEKKLEVDGKTSPEAVNRPNGKPQPTAVIITACLAVILLVVGAYLKFFAAS